MSSAGGRITAGAGANLLGAHVQDRNADATCYVGNLEPQVSEEVLWEIFVQAGPVGKREREREREREMSRNSERLSKSSKKKRMEEKKFPLIFPSTLLILETSNFQRCYELVFNSSIFFGRRPTDFLFCVLLDI